MRPSPPPTTMGHESGPTVRRLNQAQLTDALESHAAAWTALSRLLGEIPSQDALDRVRDEPLLASWPVATDDPATRRGLRLLNRSREEGEAADVIERDYREVFHGPGKVPAPPYESVHVGADGLVFDTETLQVRSFYRRFGLQVPRLGRDPDDHVSLELELLATLAVRALDALDALAADGTTPGAGEHAGMTGGPVADLVVGIGAFLDVHVLTWVPRFGELVSEHARTDFVDGLGQLLIGTLRESAEVFAPAVPAV